MKVAICYVTLVELGAVLFSFAIRKCGAAESRTARPSSSQPDGETAQARIARALSAAPSDIAKSAKVLDIDSQRKMVVLLEGSNGFTCMPGGDWRTRHVQRSGFHAMGRRFQGT
jgi:hypothetical protein